VKADPLTRPRLLAWDPRTVLPADKGQCLSLGSNDSETARQRIEAKHKLKHIIHYHRAAAGTFLFTETHTILMQQCDHQLPL
jgi:hypothetical protein